MNRRNLLRSIGVAALTGASGCSSIFGGSTGSISIHDVAEAPDDFEFDINVTNAAMRADDFPPSVKISLEYTGEEPYNYAPRGFVWAAPVSAQYSDKSTPGLLLADYSVYPPFDPHETWSEYKESYSLTDDCWSFTEDNTYFQLNVPDVKSTFEPGETINQEYGFLGVPRHLESSCPDGEFRFSQSYPHDYDLFWDHVAMPEEEPEPDFEWGFTVRFEPES